MGQSSDDPGEIRTRRFARRTALKLMAAGVGGLILGVPKATKALAISYSPGWNLVSGPPGSTLVGASGSLYTILPDGSGYASLPVTNQLANCVGYWAYFPSGGSLLPGPDGTPPSGIPSLGIWTMVGNPSASLLALVSAAQVYTYTPSGGYVPSNVLSPGSGAWALDPNNIAFTMIGVSATSPGAVPAPSPATNPAPPIAYPLPSVTGPSPVSPGHDSHASHASHASHVSSGF